MNTFKHDIKRLFFDKLQKENDNIFIYLFSKLKVSAALGFRVYENSFIHMGLNNNMLSA